MIAYERASEKRLRSSIDRSPLEFFRFARRSPNSGIRGIPLAGTRDLGSERCRSFDATFDTGNANTRTVPKRFAPRWKIRTATADFQNCSSRTDRGRELIEELKIRLDLRARRCPPLVVVTGAKARFCQSPRRRRRRRGALSRRQLIKLHNKRKLCGGRYRVAPVLSRDARDPAMPARSLARSSGGDKVQWIGWIAGSFRGFPARFVAIRDRASPPSTRATSEWCDRFTMTWLGDRRENYPGERKERESAVRESWVIHDRRVDFRLHASLSARKSMISSRSADSEHARWKTLFCFCRGRRRRSIPEGDLADPRGLSTPIADPDSAPSRSAQVPLLRVSRAKCKPRFLVAFPFDERRRRCWRRPHNDRSSCTIVRIISDYYYSPAVLKTQESV